MSYKIICASVLCPARRRHKGEMYANKVYHMRRIGKRSITECHKDMRISQADLYFIFFPGFCAACTCMAGLAVPASW